LIGQLDKPNLAQSDDEEQLVLLLRRYAARKRGRQLIVIFDHGVYGYPKTLDGYGVKCYFAIPPKVADDELIRRICKIEKQQRGDWQVITSDRAVATVAQKYGIAVISAQDFANRLRTMDQCKSFPKQEDKDDKKEGPKLSATEVEEWLQIFGVSQDAAD
jgi:predicted RNA-binding protein with PIN domain